MGKVVNRILVCYYQNVVAKKPNFVMKSTNKQFIFSKQQKKCFQKIRYNIPANISVKSI